MLIDMPSNSLRRLEKLMAWITVSILTEPCEYCIIIFEMSAVNDKSAYFHLHLFIHEKPKIERRCYNLIEFHESQALNQCLIKINCFWLFTQTKIFTLPLPILLLKLVLFFSRAKGDNTGIKIIDGWFLRKSFSECVFAIYRYNLIGGNLPNPHKSPLFRRSSFQRISAAIWFSIQTFFHNYLNINPILSFMPFFNV